MGRKKGHKLYAFIVLVLGIAIVVLGILVLFYVQEAEVNGNEYCSDREIVDAVRNDKYSINTLYIVGKYALDKGEIPPCLEKLKVGLAAPWKLSITVKEKPIVAYVYAKDEYAYVDKEGLVVKKGSAFLEGLPCIEGIDLGETQLYEKVKTGDKKIFEEVLETSRLVASEGLKTDKIVCKDNTIYLYIGNVCVNLGSSVSPEQIAQTAPIIEKLGDQSGTLHLENYAEGNTTITFRVGEIPEEN